MNRKIDDTSDDTEGHTTSIQPVDTTISTTENDTEGHTARIRIVDGKPA